MEIPDDIFDNDDDVNDDMDAHARAEETGKETKKEKVVQSTAVVRALLMKQLSAAALDSPTTAATMGMKKVRDGNLLGCSKNMFFRVCYSCF